MIEFIIIGIIIILLLTVGSMIINNYVIGALASMGMIIIGITILKDGFLTINNSLSQAFGVIILCVGAYLLIAGGIEQLTTADGGKE